MLESVHLTFWQLAALAMGFATLTVIMVTATAATGLVGIYLCRSLATFLFT